MIDAQAVFELMMTLGGLPEEQRDKALRLCEIAADEMSNQLTDSAFGNEKAVIYACAAVSLYRYHLSEGLSDDDYESLKAGDITVKRSPSLKLEIAENLKDTALSAAARYLNDMSFAFKVV